MSRCERQLVQNRKSKMSFPNIGNKEKGDAKHRLPEFIFSIFVSVMSA